VKLQEREEEQSTNKEKVGRVSFLLEETAQLGRFQKARVNALKYSISYLASYSQC